MTTFSRSVLVTLGGCMMAVTLAQAAPAGNALSYALTTIHRFAGSPTDGNSPGGLAGFGGVLYGTTTVGGSANLGTVYSLTPMGGNGRWTETVIHNFPGGAMGYTPSLGLAVDASGVLYGIAKTAGGSHYLAYSLSPPAAGGGTWTYAVLCVFPGGAGGLFPNTQLTVGAGVLYGTMYEGGADGEGVVFALTPPAVAGGMWTETVLYTFTGGSDSGTPAAGVVLGNSGVLYGTTTDAVYSLTPPASPGGVWTEAVLHSFPPGGSEGGLLDAGVLVGRGGVLYGTALDGGVGYGAVFSLTPPALPGGTWTETTLYSFPGGQLGQYCQTPVALGPGGKLFGTAGGSTSGLVFELSPPATPGGVWAFTVLADIVETQSNEVPVAGVVVTSQGFVYGTTPGQPRTTAGTVFALLP